MDAAIVVFARDGYMGSRISDISAQAGLSNGAFYRYFTDKRHIMSTIIAEFLEGSNQYVAEPFVPDDPSHSVRLSTERHLTHYQQNSDLYALLAEVGQVDHEIEQLRINGYREWYARIARMLRRADSLGLVHSDVDPDTAAALLGGMAEQYGYLVYVRKVELPDDPAYVADQIVGLWRQGIFVEVDDATSARAAKPAPAKKAVAKKDVVKKAATAKK
jgi:AcrR family transcriptional regulator